MTFRSSHRQFHWPNDCCPALLCVNSGRSDCRAGGLWHWQRSHASSGIERWDQKRGGRSLDSASRRHGHTLLEFKHFGISSAAGGLLGALLGSRFSSPVLAYILGALLIFAGLTGLTGISKKMRFGRKAAWLGGAVSGVLGGLVGNQGGVRSAALLGFNLEAKTFVATATAIALIVDGARMPVYFFTSPDTVHRLALWIVVMVAGGTIGTIVGGRVLARIPELYFRRLVSLLILALGIVMLFRVAK
jgi:uncharacterized membrane protein YfcA